MRFVLATSNPGKVLEMRETLLSCGIDVISKTDAGFTHEIEETGATFRENALLKAEAVCHAVGLPSIADDSGLCVDALDGAPGVHSKRYGGVTDSSKIAQLCEELKNKNIRTAKFVSHIVCMFPNGDIIEASGECHGEITTVPRGSGGFGYDPVFLLPDMNKTMAELTPEEKNAVSHRGNALRAFVQNLKNYLEEHPC